jgi:hypothetical protein
MRHCAGRRNRLAAPFARLGLAECVRFGSGVRGITNAGPKRRLTDGLGKTWSQNRTFG